MTGLLTVVALTGCSVGEEYRRPATPTPAAWEQPMSAQADWPSNDWWRGFHSEPLDQLMAEAEQGNFDIAQAVARVRQADALTRVAGAPLLPSVGAAASAGRQGSPNLNGIQTAKQGNLYAPTLSASYELDFWGKNAAALASAQSTAEAARFDRATVALTIQAAVAGTYFDILGLREHLTVARQNLADAEHVLDAYRERMAIGAATQLDVAQQESVVAVQRAVIPPLEQDLQQNHDALAVLVGTLPEGLGLASGELGEVTVPVVTPGLPSQLLARRPDVQVAEARLKAANADITVARAAFFPSIDLTIQGGVESVALSSLLRPESALFNLAAGLTQPIFEGGRLEGALELKQARYDELVQAYRKTAVAAFSDVEDALVAVRKTTEEEDAQRRAEATAGRAYEIAQAQMQAGTANIFAVLNTQRALFQAKDARVQATVTRLRATLALFKALGGGWQQTAANVN